MTLCPLYRAQPRPLHVTLGIFLFLLLQSPAQAQVNGEPIGLFETAVAGTPTGVGVVEMFVNPGFSGPGYANIVVDLDSDGLEPSTDDWWVQNFPVVVDTNNIGDVGFPFDLLGLTPAGSFDVYGSFTSSPVGSPSLGSMVLAPALSLDLDDVGNLQDASDIGGHGRPGLGIAGARSAFVFVAAKSSLLAVETASAVASASSVQNPAPA